MVRSQESRRKLRSNDLIKVVNTGTRQFGAITVDNEGYGRYQGEVQICKVDLPQDEKVNVIGQVVQTDKSLIPYIGPGQTFRLLHK